MYIRNFIASTTFLLARPTNKSVRLSLLAQQMLPYVFYRRNDGRFLALNRQYKPLGFPCHRPRGFFKYDSDDYLVFTIPPEEFKDADSYRLGEMALHVYKSYDPPWASADGANQYQKIISETLGIKSFSELGEQE
jgi:hypothetical protein